MEGKGRHQREELKKKSYGGKCVRGNLLRENVHDTVLGWLVEY